MIRDTMRNSQLMHPVEWQFCALPHLRQRELERGRRFGADRRGGLAARTRPPVGVERRQNVLDAVARTGGRWPPDAAQASAASAGSAKAATRGVDRTPRRRAPRPDRQTAHDGTRWVAIVAAPRRLRRAGRRSARNRRRAAPGSRGRNQVAPTSGKKPMPTSGMANR